jgi:hypothetical protein
MRKEDRYLMRKKGLPYYLDDVLERTPVGLNIYELFDGREVKWGVREEFISIFDDRLCQSTPLFTNMVDENGKDKERIIYLPGYKHIIHGNLDGKEVLCQVDKTSESEFDYFKIMDLGGKDIQVLEKDDEKIYLTYDVDGLKKYIYFDYINFKPCSNSFDYIDTTNYFLKSYQVSNRVKLFFGKLNDNKEVLPYGYDVINDEFIQFPLTDDGLIDEEIMNDYVSDDPTISSSYENYKYLQETINKGMDLGVYCRDVRIILENLNKAKTMKK